eukprot:2378148-Rhodomonas_salina.1
MSATVRLIPTQYFSTCASPTLGGIAFLSMSARRLCDRLPRRYLASYSQLPVYFGGRAGALGAATDL